MRAEWRGASEPCEGRLDHTGGRTFEQWQERHQKDLEAFIKWWKKNKPPDKLPTYAEWLAEFFEWTKL